MAAISYQTLPVPPLDGVGAAVFIPTLGGLKTLFVGGTFDCVVTIEGSADGVNFAQIDSFTGADFQTVDMGFTWARVRISAYRGGTPIVSVGSSNIGCHSDELNVPAATGVGTALNIENQGPQMSIIVADPFTGTITIEISGDGIGWAPYVSFTNPGIQTENAYAKEIRVRRSGVVGGATPRVWATSGNDPNSASAPFTKLIFRPGVAPDAPNVYEDWELLALAVESCEGDSVIHFDNSVAPCVIPPGTYNMEDCTWESTFPNGTVIVPEGVVLLHFRHIGTGLTVDFTGTTPPVSDFMALAMSDVFLVERGGTILCSGAGPFLQNNVVGSLVQLVMRDVPGLISGGTEALHVGVAGALQSVVALSSFAQISANSISGVAGSSLQFFYASSTAFISESQPNFLGTVSRLNISAARMNPNDTAVIGATLAAANDVVRCDPTLGGFTVTLPPANGGVGFMPRGQWVIVKNVTASANVIQVDASVGDTVDGGASVNLAAAGYSVMRFISDGVSEWMVV